MNITLEKYGRKDIKWLKRLYLTAFPADERAPFALMHLRAWQGRAEMMTARYKDRPVGLAYIVRRNDLVYLFYLAVAEKLRGKGIGGSIISAVREKYHDCRIFLAREQLDEEAENYPQRLSRHNFYLRCGFSDLPLIIKEGPVTYDVMSIGGGVSPKEYDRLITQWSGKLLRKMVDMKLIRKE